MERFKPHREVDFMQHEGKTFDQETILLDQNEYVRCAFVRCDLQFGGSGGVAFSECRFDQCRWSFVDAASNTLHFMASLYHGLGDGGKRLMEDLFESIRNAPPPGMSPSGGSTEP